MGNKKIDRVYIIRQSDELDVGKIYAITEIKEAEKEAKEMERRNNGDEKYKVKIINEYVTPEGYGFNCHPSEVDAILEKHKNR